MAGFFANQPQTFLDHMYTNMAVILLLYKVVRSFCLSIKISLTTEQIEFLILGMYHIGPGMV